MSEMFTSVLRGSALDWFLNNLSIEISYSDIAIAVIQRYNLQHLETAVLNEVEDTRFSTLKQMHGMDNDRAEL